MPPPVHTATDYLWQFQRLLPRGRIWTRGWGTARAAHLLTLMPTWARLGSAANDLLVDTFPCTTSGLLPEWEASLGLPSPCTGQLDTIEQRVAAVCVKFSARGGQSIDYFVALAEAMGFTVTIQQFSPFYAGRNRVSDRLFNEYWAYVWQVTITAGPGIDVFRVGANRVGDRLRSWDVTLSLLVCVFEQYRPAHTNVIFAIDVEGVA